MHQAQGKFFSLVARQSKLEPLPPFFSWQFNTSKGRAYPGAKTLAYFPHFVNEDNNMFYNLDTRVQEPPSKGEWKTLIQELL